MTPILLLIALFLSLVQLPGQAPPPRQVTLGPPTGRSPEGFSRVSGVGELRDGRVIVADAADGSLHLIDFDRRTIRQVGRHGDGPGEHRGAHAVLAWPGDSLLVWDGTGRRILVLSPDGMPVRSQQLPSELFINRLFGPVGAVSPRGELYAELAEPLAAEAEVALVRADGAITGRAASLRLMRADQAERRALTALPFRDAWAVRPDGLLAVVEADGYRVRWYRSGRELSTPTQLPWTKLPVTPAEVRHLRDSLLTRAPRARLGFRGGAGSAPDPRSTLPDAAFPGHRPAVPTRVPAAWFDPAGRLWIQPERASTDSIPRLDIVAAQGQLIGRLRLPPNSRIVGMSARAVYLLRTDADDVQWVDRHPLPSQP